MAIPIGIKRGYRLETGGPHRANSGFPFGSIGQIKDQKVILGRRATSGMTVGMRELKMIGCTGPSQHRTVEAAVILKSEENLETEAIAIKTDQRLEMISRPGHA